MRSALAFLTILPVGRSAPFAGRRTLLAFPVAGLVVGLAWWVAGLAGDAWAGPALAAALVLVADLVVTGALHQDAVADVADALGSRRPAASVREVLGDPRVGGIGAAALVVVGLLRFAAVAAVIAGGSLLALLAVPVVGRSAMVVAMAALPAGGGSLSSELVGPARGSTAWITAGTAVVVAAAVALPGAGVVAGAVAAVLGLVAAGLAGVGWRRRYGFPSGDLAGAAGVLAEMVVLLGLAGG